jgi:hypothetical protein
MRRHQKKAALFALGAAMVVLASLGLVTPGLLGRTQGEKAAKGNPTAAHQPSAPMVSSRAATSKGGRDCCSEKGQTCCSGAQGNCACCQREAPHAPLGTRLLARAEQTPKDEQKMASPEAKTKGKAARKAIVAFEKALSQDGVYHCCITPGCEFCPDAANMCPCATSLRKGGPVCPECWGGWIAGNGWLPGVKAADVKVLPEAKLKMMYDMRAKNFEQAQK